MMQRGTTAILLVIVMASVGSHGSTEGPDRQANYVGAGTNDHGLNDDWLAACELVAGVGECPTPVPSGVGIVTCDDESILGSGIQGIGVVNFCRIPLQSHVLIEIEDEHVETVYAQVFCRLIEDWNHLFDVHGSGAGEVVHTECSSGNTYGETRLQVRLHLPPAGAGATKGVVYLTFL